MTTVGASDGVSSFPMALPQHSMHMPRLVQQRRLNATVAVGKARNDTDDSDTAAMAMGHLLYRSASEEEEDDDEDNLSCATGTGTLVNRSNKRPSGNRSGSNSTGQQANQGIEKTDGENREDELDDENWDIDEKENQTLMSKMTTATTSALDMQVFVPSPPTEAQLHSNRNRWSGGLHPLNRIDHSDVARLPSPMAVQSPSNHQSHSGNAIESSNVVKTLSVIGSSSNDPVPMGSNPTPLLTSDVPIETILNTEVGPLNDEDAKPTEVIASSQSAAVAVNATDLNGDTSPYEWAYIVWRRKKLLPPVRGQAVIPSSTNRPVTTVAHEPTISQGSSNDEEFANVLLKWKSISDDSNATQVPVVPETTKWQSPPTRNLARASVGRSTTDRPRQSWIPPVKQRQSICVPPVVADPIRRSTGGVPAHGEVGRRVSVSHHPQPPLQEDESTSPVHETPKSQAWKLKMNQQQEQKIKSTPQERQRRAKRVTLAVVPSARTVMAASAGETVPGTTQIAMRTLTKTKSQSSVARSFVSPPMSRKDYKSVVQDFLRDVISPPVTDAPTTSTDAKPQSNPLTLPLMEERAAMSSSNTSVVEAESTPVPLLVSPQSTDANERSESTAWTGRGPQRERSKSQPRSSRPLSDSSLAAIRSQLQREREALLSVTLCGESTRAIQVPHEIIENQAAQRHEPALVEPQQQVSEVLLLEQPSVRVMDLSIENYDDASLPALCSSIPREVQVIENTSPLDVFSPFEQRVMRNLEKVYKEDSPIQTPKGIASASDRPWQRDRFLHRVDNFAEEVHFKNIPPICLCSKSVFSGNDDMIDFYLPLMGTACSCGETSSRLTLSSEEPTSLGNILRPWQVAFLDGFGIYRGEELVKANHRSGAALANALQRYRKREGMTPFRTKCCTMALQIWSKTSKAFVRSIRNQIKVARSNGQETITGNEESQSNLKKSTALRLPNTLYIVASFLDKMPSDGGVSMVASSGGTSTTTTNNTVASISSCSQSSDSNTWSKDTTPTSPSVEPADGDDCRGDVGFDV